MPFILKRDRGWATLKRPGVDAFLEHLAQFYEIVVYSDQLNMVSLITHLDYLLASVVAHFKMFSWHLQYVDPVIERLDQKHCIRYRLSRGDTKYVNGKHYRVCL